MRLYEGAGEATATLGWGHQGDSAGFREAGCKPGAAIRPTDADGHDLTADRPDHDRRALARLRRYAAENGCTRLVTLTLGVQTDDLAAVQRLTAQFLRRLRERYPSIAYVRVFELHASGAIHVHVLVNRFVLQPELSALWGHGLVDVRLIRAKSGTRPGREAARKAARYVGKYVTKDPVRTAGGHRYEVRQGRQPGVVVVWVDGLDPAAALEMVCDTLGVDLTYRWTSAGSPEWLGPPVNFGSW